MIITTFDVNFLKQLKKTKINYATNICFCNIYLNKRQQMKYVIKNIIFNKKKKYLQIE